MKKKIFLIELVIIVLLVIITKGFCCTSGAAIQVNGYRTTFDGRLLAWHNCGGGDVFRDVTVLKLTTGGYARIGMSPQWFFKGTEIEKGLNETGFSQALVNGLGGKGSTWYKKLLRDALKQCKTPAEFEDLLKERLKLPDAKNTHAIMAMDTKTAVNFEILTPNYYMYDALNKTRQANQFPPPYTFVAKSNAPFRNKNHCEPQSTVNTWSENNRVRYNRVVKLMKQYIDDDDKLTPWECIKIARWGNIHHDEHVFMGESFAHLILGVNKGEDPKYATMIGCTGTPDFGFYIPLWVALDANDLHSCLTTSAKEPTSHKYYNFRFYNNIARNLPKSEEYDNYINKHHENVQINILNGVIEAREHWFSGNRTDSNFRHEIFALHDGSAKAAFNSLKSSYNTMGSSPFKSCNKAPEFNSFNISSNNLNVSLSATFNETCTEAYALWGDSSTWSSDLLKSNSKSLSATHKYSSTGWKQVCLLIYDNASTKAANVRFGWIKVGADNTPPAKP